MSIFALKVSEDMRNPIFKSLKEEGIATFYLVLCRRRKSFNYQRTNK